MRGRLNESFPTCGPQEPTLFGKSSYHEPTGPSFDSLGLGVDVSGLRLHVFRFRGRGLGCTWDSYRDCSSVVVCRAHICFLEGYTTYGIHTCLPGSAGV